MSKAPKAAAPAGDAPPKSKKMLIIIIVAVVLLAGGGGAAFFLMNKSHAPKEEHVEEPKHEAKFIPLPEKFTVNLQREEGDQYLQAGITLKVLDPLLEEKVKKMMPEIHSKLLFLLSSKKPSELTTPEGKQVLVNQIINEVDGILGIAATAAHAPAAPAESHGENAEPAAAPAHSAAAPASNKTTGVVDVLFTDFIVQ